MNDSTVSFDEPVKFHNGHVLFAEGEAAKFLYLVLRGEVRIFKERQNTLHPVSVIRDKGFVGELSMFNDEVRSDTAIVSKDSELLVINKSDIRKVLKQCPDWVTNIMVTISDRLRSSVEMLREHNISDDTEGGAAEISPTALTNYSQALKEYKSRRGLS